MAIHNICLVWWPLWLANRLAFGVRGDHTQGDDVVVEVGREHGGVEDGDYAFRACALVLSDQRVSWTGGQVASRIHSS